MDKLVTTCIVQFSESTYRQGTDCHEGEKVLTYVVSINFELCYYTFNIITSCLHQAGKRFSDGMKP